MLDEDAPRAKSIHVAKPGTWSWQAAQKAIDFFEAHNLPAEANQVRKELEANRIYGLSEWLPKHAGHYDLTGTYINDTGMFKFSPEYLASSVVHEMHHATYRGSKKGVAPLGGEIQAWARDLLSLSYFQGRELDIDNIVSDIARNVRTYSQHAKTPRSSLRRAAEPIVRKLVADAQPGTWD